MPNEPTVESIVESLRRMGSPKVRDGMARFAIPSDQAFGIPVGTLRALGKQLGRNHALAAGLWDAEWYEARMLATFVDDPAAVTPVQMDRWCRDFDSWAICDTACFHLFDRTPHAFRKIAQWSTRKGEFQKRAAFALLASVALHDKLAEEDLFVECLPIIEAAAGDARNFVKKGVSWALRSIGGRSVALHGIAMALATRLAASQDSTERWIGKDAVKDLSSAATAKRLKRRG